MRNPFLRVPLCGRSECEACDYDRATGIEERRANDGNHDDRCRDCMDGKPYVATLGLVRMHAEGVCLVACGRDVISDTLRSPSDKGRKAPVAVVVQKRPKFWTYDELHGRVLSVAGISLLCFAFVAVLVKVFWS